MSKNILIIVVLLFSFNFYACENKCQNAKSFLLACANESVACAKCCKCCFCCTGKILCLSVCCLTYVASNCLCDTVKAAGDSINKNISSFPVWYKRMTQDNRIKPHGNRRMPVDSQMVR